ncbi:hypothetical protein ACA910_006789 [Epithemia clementina (nom. ined.)]
MASLPLQSSSSVNRTNTPTSVITSLEETLCKLDEYELPEEFQLDKPPISSKEKGMALPALLERYEKLREGYLESQIRQGVLEHLKTHDWNTLPSDGSENLPHLQAKHAQMTRALRATAQRMITTQQALQVDYKLLQQRREELREMLNEFRCKEGADEHDFSFASDVENSLRSSDERDDEEDDEAVQRDMAEQEELLLSLQKRKMELQAQLDGLQKEAVIIGKENMKLETNLATIEDTDVLEKENADLQKQLERLSTIKSEYDHRRLILEELAGIQIESIEEQERSEDTSAVIIQVTLLLIREYRLRATLDCPPRQAIRITDVHFLPDSNPGGLYLPPLNDLLPTAQNYCPGILLPLDQSSHSAGFRFLVHQALGRLETYKDRQAEIDELRNICRVEVRRNPSDPEDHLFQKVVCVFPWEVKDAEVTAVLRLTPDCPCVSGSLFLESLSCPATSLAHLQARVQSQQSNCASPLKLVKSLQASLATNDWKQPLATSTDQGVAGVHGNQTNGEDDMWEC